VRGEEYKQSTNCSCGADSEFADEVIGLIEAKFGHLQVDSKLNASESITASSIMGLERLISF